MGCSGRLGWARWRAVASAVRTHLPLTFFDLCVSGHCTRFWLPVKPTGRCGFAGRGGGRTIHAWSCLLLVGWLAAGSWVGFATICAGPQLWVPDGRSQCLVVAGLLNQLPNVAGIDCVRLPLFPQRRGRVMGGGGSILGTAHMRSPPGGGGSRWRGGERRQRKRWRDASGGRGTIERRCAGAGWWGWVRKLTS